MFTLEKVNELWENIFLRLVPQTKTKILPASHAHQWSQVQGGNIIRESLLTITAALPSIIRESIGGNVETPPTHFPDRADALTEYYGTNDANGIGNTGIHTIPQRTAVTQARGQHKIGETEDAVVNIPDTQLLLLLTQTVGSVVRAEPATLGHLVNWGLPASLSSCVRKAVTYRSKVNRQQQQLQQQSHDDPDYNDRAHVSRVLLNERRKHDTTIAITCTVDLFNLLITRADVVDELASVSENIVLYLKDALSDSIATANTSNNASIGASTNAPNNISHEEPAASSSRDSTGGKSFTVPLPSYTSAVLKLLVGIFRTDMSMNLLFFVQSAVSCYLCDYLLESIICAPIAAFESMNAQMGGAAPQTNSKAAQTVRAQAADVIKAILVVDEEEYYTVALRHKLENHPAWRDFGYQSHSLYSVSVSNLEPLLTIDHGDTDSYYDTNSKKNNSTSTPAPRIAYTEQAPLHEEVFYGTSTTDNDPDNAPQALFTTAGNVAHAANTGSTGYAGNSSARHSASARRSSLEDPDMDFVLPQQTTPLVYGGNVDYNPFDTDDDSYEESPYEKGDYELDTDEPDTPEVHRVCSPKRAKKSFEQPSKQSGSKLSRFRDGRHSTSSGDNTGNRESNSDSGQHLIKPLPRPPAMDVQNERQSLLQHTQHMEQEQLLLTQKQQQHYNNPKRNVPSRGSLTDANTTTATYCNRKSSIDTIGDSSDSSFRNSPRGAYTGSDGTFTARIRKGSYGWGLDLAKTPTGRTKFLQYKVLPTGAGPNLAKEQATAHLQPGDLIVAVDGVYLEAFADTVRALRSVEGDTVELVLQRMDAKSTSAKSGAV